MGAEEVFAEHYKNPMSSFFSCQKNLSEEGLVVTEQVAICTVPRFPVATTLIIASQQNRGSFDLLPLRSVS